RRQRAQRRIHQRIHGRTGEEGHLAAAQALMENYQKFVSSRGILRSCDLFNPNPQSSSRDIEYGAAAQFPAGGSIYCCTDALENFANHVLGGISEPFVLVSGDADTIVSPQTLGRGVFERILAHPTLL